MTLEIFAAVGQCANVTVPEASELAMRYYKSGNLLWILNQAWGLIVPLLFLFTGFTGKLAHFSEKKGKNWFFTIILYLFFFILLYGILNFPLDFYAGYIREHAYGFSTQSFGRWFANYWKSTGVAFVAAALFVWIFYLLVKKSPRRWWFYSSLVGIGIMFIVLFVQPIWIDPLFNRFGPMKNKELEAEILSLAARAGIEHGRVFEVDKSQDTKKINAYVLGLGSSNRIVLWDTLIAGMPKEQILFVMGHEMGHYILHHMWWDMLYNSLLLFLIFYLTYKCGNILLHRYQKRFGFNHLYNIASLPLFLFLFSLWMLLTMPLSNYISRCMEHEADRFGLEITQNNQAAGEGFLTLQQENLGNPRPGPLFKFWRSTHPPLGERVEFCNSYCPWKSGEPLHYEKYFNQQ